MEKQFRELRERLLRAGVAPRHVRRYLSELRDHLADLRAEEERAGHDRSHADARAMARLGGMDDVALAVTSQPQFKAWTTRAPWAAFSIGPVLLLAVCYLVACMILWTGWRIFLPDASTPFVGILDKRAILFFGAGRMLYFGAPMLAGWAMAFIAARQRLSSLFPVLAGIVSAVLGAGAQVDAGRTDNVRQITMTFSMGSSLPEIMSSLTHALALAGLMLGPYFVWRLADLAIRDGNRSARSES